MSLECHGGDDVEEERKREVKEKFRESETIMGRENNVRPLTYLMYNHKIHTTVHLLCIMLGYNIT